MKGAVQSNRPAEGARPVGAMDEESAAKSVRSMFDRIARRYDLLNHVLSLGVDTIWRRRVASTFRDVLSVPEARILDLCCGTGDMALGLAKLRPPGARVIVASDFSREMLSIARRKFEGKGIEALEADAMHLPLADSSLDLVVAAFGFRNLVNYENALREIYRVLAAGGQVAILEAAEPRGLLGKIYRVYFHWILPKLGAAISGNASAYRYLPASVQRFPAPADLLVTMRQAGFAVADWTPYTVGIAGLFRGKKTEEPL